LKPLRLSDGRTQNSTLSTFILTDSDAAEIGPTHASKRTAQHPKRLLRGWRKPSPALPVC